MPIYWSLNNSGHIFLHIEQYDVCVTWLHKKLNTFLLEVHPLSYHIRYSLSMLLAKVSGCRLILGGSKYCSKKENFHHIPKINQVEEKRVCVLNWDTWTNEICEHFSFCTCKLKIRAYWIFSLLKQYFDPAKKLWGWE